MVIFFFKRISGKRLGKLECVTKTVTSSFSTSSSARVSATLSSGMTFSIVSFEKGDGHSLSGMSTPSTINSVSPNKSLVSIVSFSKLSLLI